ncbi:hypothetical protein BS17DRAFT_471928 [Gyrodon lividus]|nr:hypothetical protein BS17DRAFT_471928 [Gyrodon lividus]
MCFSNPGHGGSIAKSRRRNFTPLPGRTWFRSFPHRWLLKPGSPWRCPACASCLTSWSLLPMQSEVPYHILTQSPTLLH